MTEIFVANLPDSATEAELLRRFGQYGAVEKAEIIRDRESQSYGFGFVEMPDEHEAQNAIEQLNGRDWEGCKILARISDLPDFVPAEVWAETEADIDSYIEDWTRQLTDHLLSGRNEGSS